MARERQEDATVYNWSDIEVIKEEIQKTGLPATENGVNLGS